MATKTTAKKPTAKKTNTQATAAEDTTRTVTVQGITLTVDLSHLDDFELLDDIAAIDAGNGLRAVPLVRRLLGEDYRSVLESLRDPDTSRIPASSVMNFLLELIGELSPNS